MVQDWRPVRVDRDVADADLTLLNAPTFAANIKTKQPGASTEGSATADIGAGAYLPCHCLVARAHDDGSDEASRNSPGVGAADHCCLIHN